MRKLMVVMMLLLPMCNTFGQKSNIDYEFINSALNHVNIYDKKHFLLENKFYGCYLPDSHFKLYLKELENKIDKRIFKQIVRNSHSSALSEIEISKNHIVENIGAIIITTAFIDSLQKNEDFTQPLNKRYFHTCSIPIFDDKQMYAVIDFAGGTRRNAMQGQKYLFKKINNDWILIATFGSWIS